MSQDAIVAILSREADAEALFQARMAAVGQWNPPPGSCAPRPIWLGLRTRTFSGICRIETAASKGGSRLARIIKQSVRRRPILG